MRRLLHRLPHSGRRAENAIEPRVDHHLDDCPDAAPLLADEPCARAAQLDLARRVRAVAELVLQPLDLEPRPALEEEAREPAGRLGEHEEDVGLRRRAKPLCAFELVLVAADRRGRGRVRADIGAALPLGHRHPAERALAVDRGRESRLPLGGQLGRRRPQSRNRRVRHRDGAAVPGLDLGHEHEQRGARDMSALALLRPRERVEAMREREAHELVPRRMKLDRVDPLAVAVVGAELRRVLVREPPPLERLAGEDPAEGRALLRGPARPLPLERLDERTVAPEEVVPRERRRLVRA